MAERRGLQSEPEGTAEVDFRDTVAVLYMKCGDNLISLGFIDKMNAALDKVESNSNNIRALVTTGDPDARFFSNGLELKWIEFDPNSPGGQRKLLQFTSKWKEIMNLYLTFPMPTIAAINGHSFGGGAFLALCSDYRLMRADKGWFSFNEVFVGMFLNQYLQELLRTKLPRKALRDGVVFGRRFTGLDALQSGVVDEVCGGPELVQQAVAMAKELTDRQEYNRSNIRKMKRDVYGSIVKAPFDFAESKL